MSRITKDIAIHVANKLTEKKKLEIEKLEKTFKENAYNAYLKKIPKDVMVCFEKNKEYFETCKCFRLSGNGWNYEYVYISKELPSKSSYPNISVDEKTSLSLLAEHNNIVELKNQLKKLINEIYTAIIRLGTFKKVEVEFKEAYIYLPKTVSQSLVVNIDNIRKKL